jgi:hypothetical protein
MASISSYINKIPGGKFVKGVFLGAPDPVEETTATGTTQDNPLTGYDDLYEKMRGRMDLRGVIDELKRFDQDDGRVKKVLNRIKRDAVKGLLQLSFNGVEDQAISQLWREFITRTKLDKREKLGSEARLLARDGNLPIQWVVNKSGQVCRAIPMPIGTLEADCDDLGRFNNPAQAWRQVDIAGKVLATFPALLITNGRLDPENFERPDSLGRPYLDAARPALRRLRMQEDDLVIRRRTRASNRSLHVLEGANEKELIGYENEVIKRRQSPDQDFYTNKKGAVTNISADANFDQVKDIEMNLDAFFAVAGPKGLFGYIDGMSRDILEDLKKDYYEEVDAIQDVLADVYRAGFELDLLLKGKDPAAYDFTIKFAERMTESPSQRADRALKQQSIGASQQTVLETAGLDPVKEKARIAEERKNPSDYNLNPETDGDIDLDNPTQPKVSITPGNAKKGESQTHITNK